MAQSEEELFQESQPFKKMKKKNTLTHSSSSFLVSYAVAILQQEKKFGSQQWHNDKEKICFFPIFMLLCLFHSLPNMFLSCVVHNGYNKYQHEVYFLAFAWLCPYVVMTVTGVSQVLDVTLFYTDKELNLTALRLTQNDTSIISCSLPFFQFFCISFFFLEI